VKKMPRSSKLKIDRLVYGGSGLGFLNGQAVFVPFSAPGDELEVEIVSEKKGVHWGEIREIITPSVSRTTPFCPHFTQCGGCQWQHLSYADQVAWKRIVMEDTIRRLGGVKQAEVENCIPSPKDRDYRHRVRLHVDTDSQRSQVGFYRTGSHEVVPIDNCPLLPAEMNRLLKQLSVLLGKYPMANLTEIEMAQGNKGKPVLHLRSTGELPALDEFRTLPVDGVVADLGNEKETIQGRDFVKISVGEMEFQVGSNVFFQANLGLLPAFADKIVEMTARCDQAVELYSGIGLWGCLLSDRVRRLFAFESNPPAAQDALTNLRNLKISNIVSSSTSARAGLGMVLKKGIKPDLILMDPPREGLSKNVCRRLLEIKPKQMVYISCNPATLARDIKMLLADGHFRIERIQPLDMFPHTYHIETIVRLIRNTR
jgi:23S rRNA (uracil1939-C5)-methyltransferase